ncbi:MAG: sialate O-acetylesterase [Chitinophagaceae bacterium]|nr:sialate O-acetylesterase [Chitinophagaceae bacterium]
MNYRVIFILFLFISCSPAKKIITGTGMNHFPVLSEKVKDLPSKENFYIFILAGQSNMAGRGFVQAQDTISSIQVLTLDKNNEWVYAKEPLHHYEPARTGLDCGLSFGKKLAALYKKKITIGLVPCAVGGSSVEQWLGDSTYRGVTLYSNLLTKVRLANTHGTIKGLLWHQGETNATTKNYKNYKEKLTAFFTKLRNDLGDPGLPVYAGELSSFLSRKNNPFADSVNNDLHTLATSIPNLYIIPTGDLTPNTDSIHFDSRSQRIMGKRFAEKVFKTHR